MKHAGIYVHIPFCVRKCLYCDFVSAPGTAEQIRVYTEALCLEMERTAELLPEREYRTVFIGGGTPSVLSGGQIEKIMRTLRTHFLISRDAEITMECNPGTVTEDTLRACVAAGINRLSVGLQSADDGILRRIGRIHDYAAFEETVRQIRKAGIRNFNVDVMHGLPGQTEELYLDTLRKACGSGASHISAYSLILEEGTPLYGMVRHGQVRLPETDETADMQDAGMELLKQNGFGRYEISNFARDGFRCRHNVNYWENGEYAGFGIAAHSAMRLDGWTRWANGTGLREYVRVLENGGLPDRETDRIGTEEEMFETVMLGLRMCDGISLERFADRFGRDIESAFPDASAQLRRNGWLDENAWENGRLALNGRGLELQNRALGIFQK